MKRLLSAVVTAAAALALASAPAGAVKGGNGKADEPHGKEARLAGTAPALSISTITFDVIGLDSNNVTQGPNIFPVGLRVCASGGPVSDVTLTFVWDSANQYLTLQGASTLSVASIADGACVDRYFNVAVSRDAAAYDTARRYHVEASAPGVATVSTPTPRQLYVERLVSQNRNAVTSITGPTTVYVGDTVTYTVQSHTAPGGYEQLESYLAANNQIFAITGVQQTYSAPPGATNSSVYADACGFDVDPTSPNYRSCVGSARYAGGKAGGSITAYYTALVTGTGVDALTVAIYDMSGSSYHYNSDYGSAPNLLVVNALAPVVVPAPAPAPAPTGTGTTGAPGSTAATGTTSSGSSGAAGSSGTVTAAGATPAQGSAALTSGASAAGAPMEGALPVTGAPTATLAALGLALLALGLACVSRRPVSRT